MAPCPREQTHPSADELVCRTRQRFTTAASEVFVSTTSLVYAAGTTRSPQNSCSPLPWRHRKDRCHGSAFGGHHHRRGAVAVLDHGRGNIVVLALVVERNGGADHDVISDVGGADRLHQFGAVGGAGALEAVGRDQERLECESHVEAF